MMRRRAGVVLAGALLMLSVGCRVEKKDHGDGKDVKIDTPFGGMSVRTADKDVPAMVGLEVYPGAVPEKQDGRGDQSANVNLQFGNFHLGVKAASFTTADPPAKVMDFYRKQLGRYGTVIECRGHQPVGTPAVTSAGLSCQDEHHTKHEDEGDNDLELKAGSRAHQHVVGIDPQGTGTKFGLVMLDLPQGAGDDKE